MSICEKWAMDAVGVSSNNTSSFETIEPVPSVYEQFDTFNLGFFHVHKYLCTILCILGIAANGSTMVVLNRPQMKSTANTILILIAGCDFTLMVSYLIYVIHSRFNVYLCRADEFSFGWSTFTLFHANVCVWSKACSLWLAVILAGYRRHLLASTKIGGTANRTVGKITIGCFVFVFLFCIPMFLSYNVVGHSVPDSQLGNWCTNGTVYYEIQPYDYAEVYDCFLRKFNFWVTGLVFKLLPCCFLAYCLVWIIVLMINRSNTKSKRFQQGRNSNPSATTKHRRSIKTTHRTTLILTLILSLTLLCELPCAIVSVLAGVFPKEFFHYVYRNLGDLFEALSLFNGITTFPLYCFMSASFRNTFVQLFLPCKSKPQLVTTLNERISV